MPEDLGILRSEDRGASWSVVESGTTRRLAGVTAGTDGHFVAVGWSGTVLRSMDGGLTWSEGVSDTRKALQEVAYNRLPDLQATGLDLDDRCRTAIGLANGGPATVPTVAWDGEEPMVQLLRGDSVVVEVGLAKLDGDRVLRAPGGRVHHAFDEVISDSTEVTVVIDPAGRVAEAQEGNNGRKAVLYCGGRSPAPATTPPAARREPSRVP